jgi:hypothetical protein
VLRLAADAPIAQVHVGDRSIVLPDPVRRVEIPLADAERGTALSIRAVSDDGRRAEATLVANALQLTLSFGDPAPKLAPRRRVGPAKPPPDDDGLAASPYGGKR